MAKYNEILAGRYNRHLQKLLSLKGEPPAPQLASELMPVIPVFSGREELYILSWSQFMWTMRQAAGGAGNTSAARLRNPPTSNVIAVVEKITFSGTLSDQPQILVQSDAADLTTIVGSTSGRVDRRDQRNASLIMSVTGAGGGFNGNWAGSYGANGQSDVIIADIQEFPLLPGDGLDMEAGVANQALVVTVKWRERQLEESERS